MRISFRSRLLLLFISLAGGVLLVTLLAVSVATEKQAQLTVERELQVSERVLAELIRVRGEQLLQAAQVLADDFGFREAVASGDRATQVSAMVNHGDRIGTDLMALYGVDGEVLASTHDLSVSTDVSELRGLRQVDEDLFQLVTVPVRAPDTIAYATLGFRLDDALAQSLQELTNADLSFYDAQHSLIFASSLPAAAQQGLIAAAEQGQLQSWLTAEQMAGHIASLSTVDLLISTSREDVTQPFQVLRTQYLGFGLATLLVALVFAIATARYFNQPLARLTAAAEALRRGNYQIPLDLQRRDEFGQLGETFNTMRDAIAEREQRIVYQLEHDLLTGLPNRTSLQKHLHGLLADRRQGMILVLNIVRFRALNDRLGQRFGDQILCLVANRLRDLYRDQAHVTRLAGDEFVVVAEQSQLSDSQLRERLMALVETPWRVKEATYRLEFRAGTVRFPEFGDDVDVLLRRAQLAAQLAGTNKGLVEDYQQGSDEEYLRRLQILQALPEAISARHLQLHYQPKLDCRSGTVVGVEALIRWHHPQLGIIRPDEFIPLAEQSGDILRVTEWVCEAALDQQQYWLEQGHALQMAINLSALDLQNEALVSHLTQQLHQRRLSPQRLTLEVTESAVMADLEQAQLRLAQLRESGIQIALDDYGTGYASLAQLKYLPVDELKLDQSFIRRLQHEESDRVIVQSTLSLARQLNLKTVAEGVEEEPAWQLLQQMGCDTLQGYYFCRPLAPAKLEQWLQQTAPAFQGKEL
ncbi:putative bifunctional diguanylate cyclase/phosphodiesterase [Pseudidiomarina insulisalsae]|uniref:cyclic-guanylate-specific phosphodiesterase n=1 Tax=Pseudidiomarina insulisalsae TaxID=575789 RepID=A0A432YET3_9GAMM|nr:EAL domain-containing protein [Pseudidiomarina insulisalsae]RUO59468.1 hypothetical protein CWI71_08585 [Pseudidiomarina insulisalsae]